MRKSLPTSVSLSDTSLVTSPDAMVLAYELLPRSFEELLMNERQNLLRVLICHAIYCMFLNDYWRIRQLPRNLQAAG